MFKLENQFLRIAVFALVCLFPHNAAAENWTKTLILEPNKVTSSRNMPRIADCNPDCRIAERRPFAKEGERALKGLPDGYVATAEKGDIVASLYDQPTERYAHAILGDAIEAGRLIARLRDGGALYAELPKNAVFEDRTPRIADLDRDGRNEIITILSEQRRGASIAVFGVRNNKLKLLSQTPYVGSSNRWLNIAGIADFTGNESLEIAAVWTPHIGGTLKVWGWKSGRLRLLDEEFGYSNHKIGAREQRLSAVADFDRDGVMDLAIPDAGRRSIKLLSMRKGKIKKIAAVKMPGRIDKPVAASFEYSPVVSVGLEDGSVFAIHR